MHCLYANAVVQPSVQHYSCYMAWKTKVHTWCRDCHLCINAPMWREKRWLQGIFDPPSPNSCLRNILDNHAPLKSRTITIRPSNPWYSPEIDEVKKLRKRLERKWGKTNLEVDRQIFTSQRQLVYSMIYEAKAAYYRDKISNCTDQKQDCWNSFPPKRKTKTSFTQFYGTTG